MDDVACAVAIAIRPAVSADADGVARIYLESSEYHFSFDPERYSVPAVEAIAALYREGRQPSSDGAGGGITLVAEHSGEVVGFIDIRLEESHDLMHQRFTYYHIAEIAVSKRLQNQGVGGRLIQAAEEWGRGHGAEFASLEYNTANTRAGSFYQERMGYRPASITAIKRL
jgi:GNAT superfamily N-acetyltransferase